MEVNCGKKCSCIPDTDGSGGELFQSLPTSTIDKEHHMFLMGTMSKLKKNGNQETCILIFYFILYTPFKYRTKKDKKQ